MKYIVTFIVSGFFAINVHATDSPGYIINNTGDTVRGTIDVPFKKALAGKKQADLGAMEMEIKFSENGGKAKKMKAGDIAGFGMDYEGTWYHFELLDMQKNSGKKAPGIMKIFGKATNNFNIFLHRIYDGALPLYKDYINYGSDNPNSQPGTIVSGYDLYIKKPDGIFEEMAAPTPGANKKFKEYLKKYLKLEDKFLDTVDDKAKFTDAEVILKSYNDWKKVN